MGDDLRRDAVHQDEASSNRGRVQLTPDRLVRSPNLVYRCHYVGVGLEESTVTLRSDVSKKLVEVEQRQSMAARGGMPVDFRLSDF